MPRLYRLGDGLLCDGNQRRDRIVGFLLRDVVGALVLCHRHGAAAFGERGERSVSGAGYPRDKLALITCGFEPVADDVRFSVRVIVFGEWAE